MSKSLEDIEPPRAEPWRGAGVVLRRLRISAGLTVGTVATRSGVRLDTLQRIEAGEMLPLSEEIPALLEAMGTDLLGFLAAYTAGPPWEGAAPRERAVRAAQLSFFSATLCYVSAVCPWWPAGDHPLFLTVFEEVLGVLERYYGPRKPAEPSGEA